MGTILAYETPLHVEHRRLPHRYLHRRFKFGIILSALILAIVLLIGRVFGTRGLNWSLMVTAVAVLIAMPLLMNGLISTVSVFAERAEITLRLGGVRIYRKSLGWPKIDRLEIFCGGKTASGNLPGEVAIQFIILFDGDGIGLHLKNGTRLYIGSDDPQSLGDVIAEAMAKMARPLSEKSEMAR